MSVFIMENRRLRVAKWLGTVPAVGTYTSCNREFNIPMTATPNGRIDEGCLDWRLVKTGFDSGEG